MKNIVSTFIIFCTLQSIHGQDKFPSPDLVAQLMTIPNAIDNNQDGELSSNEILNASESLLKLDMNKDGALDSKEVGAYEKDLPFIRYHNIFNLIDSNGDIALSANEIKNAANALKPLDKNNDWHLSKKELSLGKLPGMPVFSTKGLPPTVWKQFRGYEDKLEGEILPGQNANASDGYILVHNSSDRGYVHQVQETYLLDKNGNKVHEWEFKGYAPEGTVAYLLPNGQLLRTINHHNWIEDKHYPVGAFEAIQLLDWDSNVLWEFSMQAPEKFSFHHDVSYLPNGNILAIQYVAFTKEEAMALGWNPDRGKRALNKIKKEGSGLIWLERLLELKPNLKEGSTQIVWRWNTWDHLVQNKYPKKSNFGSINNPKKININYLNLDKDVPFNSGQVFHANAVDYNPELDLILLSSPTYGEVWFIDHSTSSEEVITSTGGTHNVGGDIVYRFGNNEAFGEGTREVSTLFWQHDVHWIDKGLKGSNNILVYNNGVYRDLNDHWNPNTKGIGFNTSYSNLLEIILPLNSKGQFDNFKKAEIEWSWQSENKADFYSPFMSGLQRLPNGNTLFCKAYNKHIYEVDSLGNKVMDFSLAGWGRLYRVYKYSSNYPGLKLD